MFGEILFVTLVMFLVAVFIFMPFGFFIYTFDKDPKQPFGEAHDASHGMGSILAKFDPFLQKWLAPKKAS
ncbi:MAG: hypothetical protein QF470_05305 [Methylococcales bacterium]|jgi:ABC-type antimicrobial peptide transport system permease subunit|nr:hypothetical protein [Methylococcales bacterium]